MKKILSFCTLFLVFSCSRDSLTGPLPEGFDRICFETDILPLIASNCSNEGCHNPIDKVEGLDYTTYAGIKKSVNKLRPAKSELVEYLTNDNPNDIMPPAPNNPLSIDNIELIIRWIEEGALNTTNCTPLDCSQINEVSYSSDVIPILQTRCIGCHNLSAPNVGYKYDTYNSSIISVNDNSLLGSIKYQPGFTRMPYNLGKMPNCEIEIIESWINQGAKNN